MDSKGAGPLEFDISGMHCAACSSRIERVLGNMAGIEKVSVNLATTRAKVWLAPDVENNNEAEQAIIQGVTKLGFGATPVVHQDTLAIYEKSKAEFLAGRKARLARLLPMIGFTVPLLLISMGHMLGMPLPAWLEPHENPGAFIWVQLLLTLPVIWLGRHFYVDGFGALLRRSPNMDSLVAVGTGAAFLYSLANSILGWLGDDPVYRAMNLYYESCAVLLAMIELGQFLEFSAKRKASDAMGALMSLTPESALLFEADGSMPQEVPVSAVKKGDRLLVRPGSRIPVDGRIVEGHSSVDLSLLTGESIPVPVQPGENLVGGSVNGEGSLVMEATAVGQNTRLARIIRLVADAQGSKAPIARMADRVSYYFVPAVMLFALCAAAAWLLFTKEPPTVALTIFVAVLVMACPCAMGLATPMSIMVGTGRGAQLGVLIKNGAALEQASNINVLCVDKTGTLTTGKPRLVSVLPIADGSNIAMDENTIITFASSLEGRSEHPLALAIIEAATERHLPGCPVANVKISPGLGISGEVELEGKTWHIFIGNQAFMANAASSDSLKEKLAALAGQGQTPLLFGIEKNGSVSITAILALADQLRPETPDVIGKLGDMGIRVVMLTGDNELTAKAVAKRAGISEIAAQLLPAQKSEYIKKLQKEGAVVGMVGDGLNDAPALAVADVGMAVGTGVDVSADAGDIVLMQNGMKAVLSALGLSRMVMRNIRQNLGWAFGYNILGLPVAAGILYAFGGPMLSPMLAGTAMALSSFSVVSNALRLRWYGRKTDA